ncbi:hypothetical protein IFM89_019589 [Coptis chinensis]|uniref:Histone-binding protein RBBP4-like N-terminal domain-containing protein n=1 Tax=Coptis chinensis TaxID=261450 RepID=A0A835IDB8_9MAGN|nr:hypothetical protein IFM89_019589 [Coptis chinensis]
MVRSLKSAKKMRKKNKESSKKKEGQSSSSSSEVPSMPAKVWQPGVDKIEEGEELQCDPSAYNSLHAFHIGWPCLSFDIVRDQLGLIRTEFPHTLYCVAGTQAENPSWNYIGMYKLSKISGKRRDLVPNKANGNGSEMGSDDDSSSDEDEDEGEGNGAQPPVLQLRKVVHQGGVNRIRSMAQNPHICASWADTGHVQVRGECFTPDGNVCIIELHIQLAFLCRLASCMLASGSDDGTFSIHDLRLLKGDSRVAHFEYHKQPITSIEWSPHEPSTLAVSSTDNQLTIWDLSLERDEEEEAEFRARIKEQANAPEDLPPQLLFVHQGQKDLKELHWHAQIPGMLLSTASDGFNVLMPSNIENTLPSDNA